MTWYNISWNYRKAITISNSGSSLTDYQVLITIDSASLITSIKMRSDCGDMRFTSSDGSTLLDYWTESDCNTNSTKIWVKTSSLSTGTNTIYMYYGNSSATSLSNFAATFPATPVNNGFETGTFSGWTVTGPGLSVVSGGIGNYQARMTAGGGSNCSNHTLSQNITLPSGTHLLKIYLGPEDKNGYPYWTGFNKNIWIGSTNLGTISTPNPSGYQTFTITDTGTKTLSITFVYTSYCVSDAGFRLYFDDITIRKYTSPEPTFSSIGTEELLSPANITATNMTITSDTPCISGSCIVTVDVIWTNNGGISGTFVPNITIDTIPISPDPYQSQELASTASVTKTFIISGLTTGTHYICPYPN